MKVYTDLMRRTKEKRWIEQKQSQSSEATFIFHYYGLRG